MNVTPLRAMDEDLIADREQALERIYVRTYPMVRHYVRENGGSEEDAKDTFHEALMRYYEKTVHDQLVLTSSVSTYLMGICKNLWRQQLNKRAGKIELTDAQIETYWEEPETGDQQASLKLIAFVEQLGETCKSILVSFYYFGHRLEQIAAQHGYQNIRTATVQKYKCLERLRKAVSHLSIENFKS
ncbi:hypothetical protein GCM10027347_58540 [Larkinella harenae]